MENSELQKQLFGFIKSGLPPHLSLSNELGSLLKLSADSVYRRIRGEKPLTLDELKIICGHFNLSLDQLLQLDTDTVVFRAPNLKKEQFPFIDVLNSMLEQLKHFNSFGKKKMYYLCKDMPIWQFYLFPELGAFKTFVWAKSIHSDAALTGASFSVDEYPFEDCYATGRQIIKEYNDIPSIELWNEESINSTLNQISFYKESGGFKSRKDIERVVDSLEQTVIHLRQQAEKGVKFFPGDTEVLYKAGVQLYVNEIVIGSNTILVEMDEAKTCFIPYNVFSFMYSKDQAFNDSMFNGFQTLKSRSSLISDTGEKERNRFFGLLLDRINNLRK